MVLLLPKPGHRNPVLRGPQNTSHAWLDAELRRAGELAYEKTMQVLLSEAYCNFLLSPSHPPVGSEVFVSQKPK